MKTTKTITIDKDLLEWIEQQIKQKRFASVSHAIEKAIFELEQKTTTKQINVNNNR